MGLLQALRMRNIFGTPSLNGEMDTPKTPFESINFEPPRPVEQPPENEIDVQDMINKIYTPEHTASDRFNQLAGSYPEYQKPGFLRSLGSMLVSYSKGPQAAQAFYDENNIRRRNDWKNQIEPAYQAAQLERFGNTNERTLAHQTVADELRNKQITSKEKIDEANLEIRRKRAEAYDWKTRHPTHKLVFPKGGNIISIDPITNQQIDTGIPTGTLSESDKYDLMQENAIEKIQATTQGREDAGWSIGIVKDPETGQDISVRINARTGEVMPITMGGKTLEGITKPGVDKGSNQQLDNIRTKTQETLQALDEILDDKGKLKSEIKSAVGASRMFGLQYLPATTTRAGDAAIKRLKAMLIVDLIGEMKAQSRTGATGFGQLNLRELGVLENAASKLDPSLDETTFENELIRIRERLKKILQPSDSLNPTVTPGQTTPITTKPPALNADELIKKYGGQ